MSTTKSTRYARPHADVADRPPATTVRYFYSASTSIDDPQAPVPPPVAHPSSGPKLPLRAFSELDNTSLDRAWNELRRNLDNYKQEKDASALKAKQDAASRSPYLAAQGGRSRGDSLETAKDPRHGQDTWPGGSTSQERHRSNSRRGSASGGETPKLHAAFAPSRLRDTAEYSEIESSDDQGLTRRPFARAPSRKKITQHHRIEPLDLEDDGEPDDLEMLQTPEAPSETVPVGVSRLHEVTMPTLQMRPIYWNPVNDISAVLRATWFYKETMSPVEAEVANMLERGYLDLRPWTQTWVDELNSACAVGAIGEEKIAHTLWPEHLVSKSANDSRPSTAMSMADEMEDTPERRRKDLLEATEGIIDASTTDLDVDNKAAGSTSLTEDMQKRLFMGSQVLYTNEKEAYILRPALSPSAYYGRRPLANYIRKGHSLGIPVVRGFDQERWDKLNPPKAEPNDISKLYESIGNGLARPNTLRTASEQALSRTAKGQVTDLVLVIHGIGQKLSERVESFHFTHAMNAFRREVNVEMASSAVKPHLRKGMGGLQVLPVNWRSQLSFDGGAYTDGPDDPTENHYSLKDITPETLPSVRSIISDVMLDIPYYLSHHQPKMIKAVILEANRIYRAWCGRNPGFEEYGRVHIIAHSLGSVMALDILSRQPTTIDSSLLASEVKIEDQFIFDTKNLYLCGSPAGFFLLLKKANLQPRRDRNKQGTDDDNLAPSVAGEQGQYGCLAVDNIYNIVNPYDPVAYRLNAAVDASYAAALKLARIPSATTSWFSFSNPLKSTPTTSVPSATRPAPAARLPSTVELETHNFTREEIAERRAFLLNDNGQIDFYMRYGGGALEIQYLTMLGAHSSYWTSRDFVRFVVLETGRKHGREGTLGVCRAVKKRGYAAGGGQ